MRVAGDRRLGVPGRRDPPPARRTPSARCHRSEGDRPAGRARRERRRQARSRPCAPACVIHTAYARDGAGAWATNVDGRPQRRRRRGGGRRAPDPCLDRRRVRRATRAGPTSSPIRRHPVTDYGRAKAAAEAAVAGRASGRGGRADVADLRRSCAVAARAHGAGRRRRRARHGVLHRRAALPRRRRRPGGGDPRAGRPRASPARCTSPAPTPCPATSSRSWSPRRTAAIRRLVRGAPVSGARVAAAARLPPRLRPRPIAARDALRGVREVLQGPSRSTAQAPSALV